MFALFRAKTLFICLIKMITRDKKIMSYILGTIDLIDCNFESFDNELIALSVIKKLSTITSKCLSMSSKNISYILFF
jgi:hypothetical protein